MISMDVNHPDIKEFVDIKTNTDKITKANISIRVDDEFMKCVESNRDHICKFVVESTGEVIKRRVDARKLFMRLCENNWNWAEPGILYWDKIKSYNLMQFHSGFEHAGVNPCLHGDTLVQTVEGLCPIKFLVGKNPFVYTMMPSGSLGISKATKVWKTQENAKMVKFSFSAGEVKCTPEHLIFTLNKGWVKAEDLQPGDELNGLGRRIKKDSLDLNIESQQISFAKKYTEADFIVQEVQYIEERADVYDMTVEHTHNFIANNIVVHNCAEEPLPAGGSCLLGSLNLSEFVVCQYGRTSENKGVIKSARFDFGKFATAVRAAVKALDEVLEEGLELHPLEEQRKAVTEYRQIGLGVMGIAECLMKLGMRYGSNKSILMLEKIAQTMSFVALDTSNDLAAEKGMFEKCEPDKIIQSDFFKNAIKHLEDEEARDEFIENVREHGLANSQLLTVAPTGSLSTMLNVSGGIEPMFAFEFTRKTESLKGKDEFYTITSPLIEDIKRSIDKGFYSENILVNAHMLKPIERIKVQAIWQKYTDAAISSTVNMSKDSTLDDVYEVYMEAWKHGLKGITIYRDGCKRGGVLTTKKEKEVKEDNKETERVHIELSDTNVENCAGYGAQLTTGCGTLWVTFYFHRKTGQLCHVFLDKGSTGGCNSFMVGLSRMISLAGKKGATVDEIIDQLTSTIACNSFKGRKVNKQDTSKGSSCPSAIGLSLKKLYKKFLDERVESLAKPHEESTLDEESEIVNECPDCKRELQMSGGCVQCVCGYSQCG